MSTSKQLRFSKSFEILSSVSRTKKTASYSPSWLSVIVWIVWGSTKISQSKRKCFNFISRYFAESLSNASSNNSDFFTSYSYDWLLRWAMIHEENWMWFIRQWQWACEGANWQILKRHWIDTTEHSSNIPSIIYVKQTKLRIPFKPVARQLFCLTSSCSVAFISATVKQQRQTEPCL